MTRVQRVDRFADGAARIDVAGAVVDVDAAAAALVRAADASQRSIVLAVSGGADSMVLMGAVHRALAAVSLAPSAVRVLTFDHGTGLHASRAAALVQREADRLGFTVVVGRASLAGAREAEWRAARWHFLRRAAGGATIATAHTRDDHIETVMMRILRGTGARGLASLAAPALDIVRPLLDVTRQAVRAYALAHGVPFLDDPSNESRDHLRNRVRLDLLPAIGRLRPQFGDELLALAARAARVRADVETLVARFVSEESEDGAIRVARQELATYDSAALCVLWPAIAARAQVTLDRRGTLRLAQFTTSAAPGARIPLSGGVDVYRHRDSFVVRRAANLPTAGVVALSGVVEFGEWRFRPVVTPTGAASPNAVGERSGGPLSVDSDDPWTFELPGDRLLSVRAWRPADRMRARIDGAARRVKRFFGDAHVAGPMRAGWPVVLADDEIVWIPGVRRGAAAPERSGRPAVLYACERFRGDFSNG